MAFEMLVGLNVTDDVQYQEYRKSMMPILKAYGGGFGYDFKVSEVLLTQTDSKINRVFTIYFPDKESMEQFFSNADYLKIKKIYFENSVSDTTIISTYDQS